MEALVLPDNWVAVDTITNTSTTYSFIAPENDKILITINKICLSPKLAYNQFASDMITLQISEEQHRMVEKNVKIQVISNPNGTGYYFMATDRHWTPSSANWPYLMRCIYVGTKYMIEITVLCADKESMTIKQAFELLETSGI
jgi:hypothetical protein